MSTKLTLRINPILIKRAKLYARRHQKSVSKIVGDYFLLLNCVESAEESVLSLPITASLRGVLAHPVVEDDYKHYLEKKYL